MSKNRKVSRKNVKEWIVKPAVFMALRAGAANIAISKVPKTDALPYEVDVGAIVADLKKKMAQPLGR